MLPNKGLVHATKFDGLRRFFPQTKRTQNGNNTNVTRRQREGSVYLALAGNTSQHLCVDVQLLFQNLERINKAVQPFCMHNPPTYMSTWQGWN